MGENRPQARSETLTPEVLLKRHARAVLAVCLAGARNVHDAEDVMQEVFVKALSRLNTLKDPDRARAWLLSIARRACVDRYRRGASATSLPADHPAPADDADPRIDPLHAAISRLPDDYRETISLYYLDGRNCANVAGVMGISEAAVRKRLSRARLMLHDLLAEDDS